jgi:hypothetical protein
MELLGLVGVRPDRRPTEFQLSGGHQPHSNLLKGQLDMSFKSVDIIGNNSSRDQFD